MTAKELKNYLVKNNLTFSEYMSKLRHEIEELKKYLIKNNSTFSDYMLLHDPDYDGPFCPCCGESQKDGEYHNKECIYF